MHRALTRRQWAATLGGLVVVVAGTGSTYALVNRHSEATATAPATITLASVEAVPHLVFRHTGLDAQYGQVAEVPLSDPTGPRAFTGVSCDRVDAKPTVASCLVTTPGVTTSYNAIDYDASWHQIDHVPLEGPPSRTRLSPDGILVATTSFANGSSYMTQGFSTATDIRRVGGQSYGNLERFRLFLGGKQVRPADLNIWGVTFVSDDATFYATAATHGQTYLVKGDLFDKTLTEVAEHVECPSLSPDGTTIAFKQAVSDAHRGTWWTPAVLDLATGKRTVLTAETRNVDDQIAWLDGHTLLYGLPHEGEPGVTDVWSLSTRAGATPSLYLPDAWSPAVVR